MVSTTKKRGTLSDEFKKRYVKNLKGKEHVEYNGLLFLAHQEEEFGGIRAYITQYPCAENKFTTFARAEIRNKAGEILGMEEADANLLNCNKMVGVHAPRMALTRAKGRALRDFLNIDMVTKEELLLYEPDMAQPRTIGKIKRVCKDGLVSNNRMYQWLEKKTGQEEFNELTEDQAQEFLDYVTDKVEQAKEKRASKQAAPEDDDEEEMEMD
jgi:hypothetical protein